MLILKAEHIFISNGSPVGIAAGLIVFHSLIWICPALVITPGFRFSGIAPADVSVTDGTEVYPIHNGSHF